MSPAPSCWSSCPSGCRGRLSITPIKSPTGPRFLSPPSIALLDTPFKSSRLCGAEKPCRAKYPRSPRLPFDFPNKKSPTDLLGDHHQRGGCHTPLPKGNGLVVARIKRAPDPVPCHHNRPDELILSPIMPQSLECYCYHLPLRLPPSQRFVFRVIPHVITRQIETPVPPSPTPLAPPTQYHETHFLRC